MMTATQLARVLGQKPSIVSSTVANMFRMGQLVKCATGPRGGVAYRLNGDP